MTNLVKWLKHVVVLDNVISYLLFTCTYTYMWSTLVDSIEIIETLFFLSYLNPIICVHVLIWRRTITILCGMDDFSFGCVFSGVFWVAKAVNGDRCSRKRTVMKIPPYERLADKDANCRTANTVIITSREVSGKQQNERRYSQRHRFACQFCRLAFAAQRAAWSRP